VKSYWEHVEEYIGNMESVLGTLWEHNMNNKNPTPPLSHKIKIKITSPLSPCYLSSLATRFVLPTYVLCHFWPTLIILA